MKDACDAASIERLTEASDADVAAINWLLPQLKPAWPPITLAGLRAVLASATRVYVARDRGVIIGFSLLVPHHHFGGLRFHVEDVVVDVSARRRGIGRRLIETAMAEAPDETVSFDLRSHHTRVEAHRLYRDLVLPRRTLLDLRT